jgi:tRNA(Ile)-lysidine synthase
MLACTREEVHDFLQRQGLSFFRDPMNADPAFLRVRVRTAVLPALEQSVGPGAARHLARFASLAEEDEAFLGEQANAAFSRLCLEGAALDAVGLRALAPPIRRRVLVLWLERLGEQGVDFARVQSIDAALHAGGEASIGRGAVVRATGDRLRRVAARLPVSPSTSAEGDLDRDGPGLQLGDFLLRWRSAPQSPLSQPLPSPLSGPLRVRARQPGDRVRLPGGGTRKLQDVLVDAKVPRELRDSLPLVVDPAGAVVCIAGVWPRPGAGRPSESGVIEITSNNESGARPNAEL